MRLFPWALAAAGLALAMSCTGPAPSSLAGFKIMTGPDPQPTLCPTPEDCKFTGGGIVSCNGDKVTFGYNAFYQNKGDLQGSIEVNDHGTGQAFHSNVLTYLNCFESCATFAGTLKEGGSFTATVCDYNEPGREDTFYFSTNGYTVSGTLVDGGNIQLHNGKNIQPI